jgi:hypothetical protein
MTLKLPEAEPMRLVAVMVTVYSAFLQFPCTVSVVPPDRIVTAPVNSGGLTAYAKVSADANADVRSTEYLPFARYRGEDGRAPSL